jgi:hypothetical protein
VATGLLAVDIRDTAVGFYIIVAKALIPCRIIAFLNIWPWFIATSRFVVKTYTSLPA